MSASEEFDRLSSRFDYPVFVVTAAAEGERAGCLVGFATQCSIDPIRFLVCLSKTNRTFRVADRAAQLGVHLLSEAQVDLAVLFGGETGDEVDKLSRCRWTEGPGGTPLLDECPDRFVGVTLAKVDVGDHVAFLLDVVEVAAVEDIRPLTFQQARDIEPGHPA